MQNPKDATVEVYVYPDKTPPFELKSNLIQNGELTFKNGNGHFGYVVNFTIMNAEDSGYYFPADKSLALAASPIVPGTPSCPEQGTVWDQFAAADVSTDRKTLKVNNENKAKERFGYTLFVTKKPEQPKPKCLALDPIGNNQNGQMRSSTSMSTYLAIGGALAVGVALYACSKVAS